MMRIGNSSCFLNKPWLGNAPFSLMSIANNLGVSVFGGCPPLKRGEQKKTQRVKKQIHKV